jgi:beta-lactamase class A
MSNGNALTSVREAAMMSAMRPLRILVALAVLCASACGATLPARAAAGPFVDLERNLSAISSRAPGDVGVMVEDVATGFSTGINPGANMPAASTIKIPVMVEVFRQMARGTFDLNRLLTLQASDRDYGWGDLADAPAGSRYSVAKLLTLMITESDNTATNMLIRLVGRAHINTTMRALGLRQTVVGDYIRSDGDIRSLRSSPQDMTTLLLDMVHDSLVNAWSSREMIQILAGQHHNSLLPEPLPPGTTIAHKTGTLHDTLNDVGIVYLGNDPYIISVMTTHLPSLDAGRRFIRGVSRLAYDALTRFSALRAATEPLARTAEAAAPEAPDVQMWSGTPDATAAPPDAQPQPALPTPEP